MKKASLARFFLCIALIGMTHLVIDLIKQTNRFSKIQFCTNPKLRSNEWAWVPTEVLAAGHLYF